MAIPRVSTEKRLGAMAYLKNQKILRNLEGNDDGFDKISSGCPPLDFMTGIGGIPRGRMIEMYGKESTGKCVTADTLVSVVGRSLLTMGEIAKEAEWEKAYHSDRKADTAGRLNVTVSNGSGDTEATGIYYPGEIDTVTLYTESGHTLRGAVNHRVLVLTEQGYARWTTLTNTRPNDVLLTMVSNGVEGQKLPHPGTAVPTFDKVKQHGKEYMALLGALCTIEPRHEANHFLVSARCQEVALKDWLTKLGYTNAIEENPKWSRFTGLLKIDPVLQPLVDFAQSEKTLQMIRTCPLWAQQAWASGLSLVRSQWTGEDLEIELSVEEAARVFQAVCENIGVRWMRYSTLNTFGTHRMKLALRSRLDQQNAEDSLWKKLQIPIAWKKRYAREEAENHENTLKTLTHARKIMEKAGMEVKGIEWDDTDKDNCQMILEKCVQHARSKTDHRAVETLMLLADPRITMDRATGTEKSGKTECYDLHVPIGSHYSANGIISHNSTLAMHFCRKELESQPDTIAVYFDYERAMAKKYARSLGLLEFPDRFFLLDPDSLEKADEILRGLYENGTPPSIVVVDSVAAATPQDLFGRDMEDTAPIAIRARKWAEMLEKWTKFGGDYGTTFLLLNQTRTFIGTDKYDKKKRIANVVGTEKEETPGGNAVKFYASLRIRLDVQRVFCQQVFNAMTGENEEIPIANVVRAFAIKNKVASPYRSGNFFIQFGTGIDNVRTMVDSASSRGFVKKSGGTFSVTLPDGQTVTARGEVAFIDKVKESRQVQEGLTKLLQWDKAETLMDQSQGTTVYNPNGDEANGADTDRLAVNAAMKNITLAMIDAQPTLSHKAAQLQIITQKGSTFTYTTAGGEEVRSKDLTVMDKKIRGTDREALQAQVDEIYKTLKETEQQEKKPTLNEPIPGENEDGTLPEIKEELE